MKKTVILIYCFIVVVFVSFGFVFGSSSKTINEGYRVYDYSHKEKYSNGGEYYPSEEVGDSRIDNLFGWYGFYYVRNTDYYEGNIKIPKETLKKATSDRQLYAGEDPDFDFHHVYFENIIISIIAILILVVPPIIILLVLKKKENKNKKTLV